MKRKLLTMLMIVSMIAFILPYSKAEAADIPTGNVIVHVHDDDFKPYTGAKVEISYLIDGTDCKADADTDTDGNAIFSVPFGSIIGRAFCGVYGVGTAISTAECEVTDGETEITLIPKEHYCSVTWTVSGAAVTVTQVLYGTAATEPWPIVISYPACDLTSWDKDISCITDDVIVNCEIIEHVPVQKISDVVDATCTEDGSYYEEVRCSRCRTLLKRGTVTVPKLGHDIGHYDELTSPACTATGSAIGICARCGFEDVRDTPALGHMWGDWSEWTDWVDNGTNLERCRQRQCARCLLTETEGEVKEKEQDSVSYIPVLPPVADDKDVTSAAELVIDVTDDDDVVVLDIEENVDIPEAGIDVVPVADELPKTGTGSALLFFGFGTLLMSASALVLFEKKE